MRPCAIQTYRSALHALLALGPYGGSSPARVTRCHTKAAVTFSLPTIARQCDRVLLTGLSLSRVLETPPLPATPPGAGTGGTTPGSSTASVAVPSSETRDLVSQERPR